MKATAIQIQKFTNTVKHSAEHPSCVRSANNVMRMKAKLDAKGVDTQGIIDRFAD